MTSSRPRWWQRLRSLPPGQRFAHYYETRQRLRAQGQSHWNRPLRLVGALVCIAIAIPLMILPGPAVLFYGLAGLLIAGESLVVARALDRVELGSRRLWRRWRSRAR